MLIYKGITEQITASRPACVSAWPAAGRGVSLYHYVMGELSRGYLMEEDKNMFTEKQKRVNTFMKTPRELEKVRYRLRRDYTYLVCDVYMCVCVRACSVQCFV